MSKIITISNLERFHGHLNLSGGNGYIKEIKANDTTGNIYINTSDENLYYKKSGTWNAINLYSNKPRAKNLVLKVSNKLKYAGLINPSDANASDIRVRIGDTIYAVESQNPKMWIGDASVENGTLIIAPQNYIYSPFEIILGGTDDVEIYVKKAYRNTRQLNADGKPYFSLVRKGKSANSARDTTREATVWQDITVQGKSEFDTTGMIYRMTAANNYSKGGVISGSSYGGQILAQAQDIKVERDYKWIYDSATKYFDFVSETCNIDTRSGGVMRIQYHSTDYEPTHTVYIAMGDMTNSNYGTMIVTDFYVKINNVKVLSFSDLINQFS